MARSLTSNQKPQRVTRSEQATHRDGEVEDELEGELAELAEEKVAEHDEGGAHQRERRGTGSHSVEDLAVPQGLAHRSRRSGCHSRGHHRHRRRSIQWRWRGCGAARPLWGAAR